MTEPKVPSQSDIERATRLIRPHIRRTPFLRLQALLLSWTPPVMLKLEMLQHSGSFKTRGAFFNLLDREIPSGGNHVAARARWGRSTRRCPCPGHCRRLAQGKMLRSACL